MKASDEFFYVKGQAVTYDNVSLCQLYLPIIGLEAMALYGYLQAFWDNGNEHHQFAEILSYLACDLSRIKKAFDTLQAMDLVDIHQQDTSYAILVKPALPRQIFMANLDYRQKLERVLNPTKISQEYAETSVETVKSLSFDLDSFQKRMAQDGLIFPHEREDLTVLSDLAERFSMDWLELYQLAKETAHQYYIQPNRMVLKKEQTAGKKETGNFSESEKLLLHQVKREKPEMILAQIKKDRRAMITVDELKLLDEMVQMSFLDEVINVMIIYTLAKTKSANLNKNYLQKLANDFAHQRIDSAEKAVEKLRSFEERKATQVPVRQPVSNVPSWSKEEYQREASEEDLAKLNALIQGMEN